MRLLEPGRKSSESVRSCWACNSSARAHGSQTNGALSTAMRACKPGPTALLLARTSACTVQPKTSHAMRRRRRVDQAPQGCHRAASLYEGRAILLPGAGQDVSTRAAAAHLLQGGQHAQHLHEALVGAAPLSVHILLQSRADGDRIVKVAAGTQVVLQLDNQAVGHGTHVGYRPVYAPLVLPLSGRTSKVTSVPSNCCRASTSLLRSAATWCIRSSPSVYRAAGKVTSDLVNDAQLGSSASGQPNHRLSCERLPIKRSLRTLFFSAILTQDLVPLI